MAEFQRIEPGVGQSRRGVSEKCPRGYPTGITPLQKGKRPAVQSKDSGHRPGNLNKRPENRGACLSPANSNAKEVDSFLNFGL